MTGWLMLLDQDSPRLLDGQSCDGTGIDIELVCVATTRFDSSKTINLVD